MRQVQISEELKPIVNTAINATLQEMLLLSTHV